VIGATSTAVAIGLCVRAAFGSAAIATLLLVVAVIAPLAWSLIPSPATGTRVRAPRPALALTARALPMPLPRQGRLGSVDDLGGESSPYPWTAYGETAPIARVAIEVS
jgi:hypothetical protein